MFSRWKGCSTKFVVLLVIFFIVDFLFIWAIIMNKQQQSNNTSLSFEDKSTEVQIHHEEQQQEGAERRKLKPFINYENLKTKGGLGELEFKVWLNRESWQQNDPELVNAVRQIFLIPPPPPSEPYRLGISNAIKRNPSDGQVQAVEKFLKKLTPGFFIECGANDGELNSNTLWLEKEMGWTGLLVEADPYPFERLRQKNRKAWLANVCLSGYRFPRQITFYRNPVTSEAGGLIYDPYYGAIVPIGSQCIPLYTILLALNRTTVDFLSLDVEGNELQILKTIPFDSVIIKVMTIEHIFIEEGRRALWEFMKSKGYILYKTVKTKITGDSIFIHPSLLVKETNSNNKNSLLH